MKVGFIGLGKMGTRKVEKLLKEGHEVSVWNRSKDASEDFRTQNEGVIVADSISSLINNLQKPRIVWIMVTAKAVEEVLSEISKFTEKDDIIIDGGNSFFKDTERRYKELKEKGIHFLGIGTSGGVHAAKNGFPFMVGGSKEGYEQIKPILDSLSKPGGGHEYFGEGGAGHFVKMIHNGIEYGVMQSLGEGFEVLEKSPYRFDLLKIAKLWQKGTLVSGFMLDRAKDALEKDQKLSDIVGVIEESGEARWTVDTAKEENVPVEIIERSLDYRKRSKDDPEIQNSFTAKLVSALRREFGGHPVRHAQGYEEVKKK